MTTEVIMKKKILTIICLSTLFALIFAACAAAPTETQTNPPLDDIETTVPIESEVVQETTIPVDTNTDDITNPTGVEVEDGSLRQQFLLMKQNLYHHLHPRILSLPSHPINIAMLKRLLLQLVVNKDTMFIDAPAVTRIMMNTWKNYLIDIQPLL